MEAEEIVLGELSLLFFLLQALLELPPDVPEGDLGLLRFLRHEFCELVSALFREARDLDADELPIVLGVQPKISSPDGLLDGADLGFIKRPNHQEIRVGCDDVGELPKRGGHPVVLHADVLQKSGVGPTGVDLAQFLTENVQGLPHPIPDLPHHRVFHSPSFQNNPSPGRIFGQTFGRSSVRIPVERIWQAHPTAQEILERLQRAGHLAVLVGGVVRDALLAELRGEAFAPKDVDIATSAPPAEVVRLFSDRRVLQVGEAFGVVVVVGADGREYEVATFRAEEGYSDGRRPDRVRWADLAEDLHRRDFTVNGLAATPEGEVLDLVSGVQDLRAGLLRTIGAPEARFSEDYLRMLRAVRFACQLGFSLEEKTAAAIRAHAPKILGISWERIRDELLRLLATPRASQGLRLLAELGLLPFVLPEIDALRGVPQPEEYHPEGDVFSHTVLALGVADGLWDAPLLKLAVLFHDAGKPQALVRSGGEHMAGHCQLGAKVAEEALARLRLPKKEAEYVAFLVAEHMRVARLPEIGLGKQVLLLCQRENAEVDLSQFPWRFPAFSDLLRLLICDAEASAHRSAAWLPVLAQAVQLLLHLRRVQGIQRARELLRGEDLLALGEPPGPRLGRVLAQIHERILAGDITTREEALREAAKLLAR